MEAIQKSRLESVLSIFTEVHAQEGKKALLMALNIFLILTAYLIAKVVREPLILSGSGGAELKSYASVLQVFLLLGAVQLFGWLASNLSRRKLINYVTLFFIGCFFAFYLSLITIGPSNGIVYFLWVGIFSLMIIAQFWAFANDIYTPKQGKRLFVLLAFGASAGGVFGPMLASLIFDLVGLYNLLLVSAGILLVSLLLTNYIMTNFESPSSADKLEDKNLEPEMGKEGALKVVFNNKYLLMIALLILITNFVNSTGEYILGKGVEEAAVAISNAPGFVEGADKDFIGKFYADFFTVVGFLGLLLQLLVVSRILKYFGVRFAIMTLPIIALGTYLSIAIFPLLAVIRWGKTVENATDYSLNNTVRHILFLPTTKEEKYKAKVAIDSFFVRAGDVLSAGLVFVGVTWLSFSLQYFAAICLALVVVWLFLAFWIGKENKRLVDIQNYKNSEI